MHSFKRQVPFNYPIIWKGKVTESLRDGKNSPLLITDERFMERNNHPVPAYKSSLWNGVHFFLLQQSVAGFRGL